MTDVRSGPVLRTARLTLRPLETTDAPAIVAALTDHRVATWLTSIPQNYGLDQAKAFIAQQADDDVYWALDAGAGLIGVISIRSELGYWLRHDDHAKGLMTEAARAVVDWHFATSNDPLMSSVHVGNVVSARILHRLGFAKTVLDRNVARADGSVVDIQRMTLTAKNWRG